MQHAPSLELIHPKLSCICLQVGRIKREVFLRESIGIGSFHPILSVNPRGAIVTKRPGNLTPRFRRQRYALYSGKVTLHLNRMSRD